MITRRCSERRFFLRPDDDTNDAFIYCLGLAAMPSVPRLHAKPPRQSRKSSRTRCPIPPLHSQQSLLLWGITCAHLIALAYACPFIEEIGRQPVARRSPRRKTSRFLRFDSSQRNLGQEFSLLQSDPPSSSRVFFQNDPRQGF
jgi:hypothetical protein